MNSYLSYTYHFKDNALMKIPIPIWTLFKQHWAYIIPIRGEPKSISYEIQSAVNCFSISLVPVEVLWVRFELMPWYRTTQETILEPAKRECSPFHLISPNNIKILWTTHFCLGTQSELRSVRYRSRRRDVSSRFYSL